MGKMKSYMMDMEDHFEELLIQAVPHCDSFEEFVVCAHQLAELENIDLMENRKDEIIDYVFESYWEKFNV
jgi:hypothetical protein